MFLAGTVGIKIAIAKILGIADDVSQEKDVLTNVSEPVMFDLDKNAGYWSVRSSFPSPSLIYLFIYLFIDSYKVQGREQ